MNPRPVQRRTQQIRQITPPPIEPPTPPIKKEFPMTPKQIVALVLFVLCLLGALIIAPQLYENVHAGKYHIAQSPFTGKITAYMTPGPYCQWFANVTEFPVSETFYFTKDTEGGNEDWSVSVQFMDGSKCQISGTCRVDLPKDGDTAIKLVTEHGYRTHDQLEDKLILPVVRRSLIMTANQMSAKDSYASKRADFIASAWDQIENGVYITKDEVVKEIDPTSGQSVTRTYKVPVLDEKGIKMREHNPLKGTGVTLSNFEIKEFAYEQTVQTQIAEQQKAMMAVQTARANALKAEQDALTVEAEGKAAVMKAKYEEEQKKIRATVEAEKEKEVAIIAAQKSVDVAQKEKEQALTVASRNKEVNLIELDAAKLEKDRRIALAQGEAEGKRLVMAADNALQAKLQTYEHVQKVWADAFAARRVPGVVMGQGNGSTDNDAAQFMQILGVKAARDLALDMEIKTPSK